MWAALRDIILQSLMATIRRNTTKHIKHKSVKMENFKIMQKHRTKSFRFSLSIILIKN